MQPEDIVVERTEEAIFANVTQWVMGKLTTQVIWQKVGAEAEPYRKKTDEEIQTIAFQHWSRLKNSIMRRRRAAN